MPPGAARAGARLSALLRARGEAEAVGAVLDALAREIWLSQESKGLTMAEAEEHVLALAGALDAFRPDPDDVRAALGFTAPHVSAKANGGHSITERMAAGIVARAGRTGLVGSSERGQDIAAFLLERMLTHIFADRGLLPSLVPAFKAIVEGGGADASAAQTAGPAVAGAPAAPVPTMSQRNGPESGTSSQTIAQSVPVPATVEAAAPGHLARIQQRYGLSPLAAQRLSALVEAKGAGNRPERVEELAAWIAAARAQLLRPSNESQEIQRLNAEAAVALAEADFEAATAILDRVRGSVRQSRRLTEARLKEELASLQRHEAEEAQATSGLAELALARREYDRAAALFQEAAEGVSASEPSLALKFVMQQAEALYRKGLAGDEGALRQSAQILALALQQARAASDKRASALAELGIGKVLCAQAERGGDPAMPMDAVGAFRRALAVLTRDEEPGLWAETQSELGSALALAGSADAGPRGLVRLQEAAVAYQTALAALSREATPLRWALTQVKLGGVLVRSGERSDHPRFWLAAATALFNALEVFEAEGAVQHADMTRLSLRQFQHRLPAALGQQGA